MNSSNLTFVHADGASKLSQSALRQMRAHVTRTNFAERRLRKSRKKRVKPECIQPKTSDQWQAWMTLHPSRVVDRILPSLLALHHRHFDQELELSNRFWSSLFFSENGGCPRNSDEIAWVDMIASEPSLLNTTIAIGMKYWSSEKRHVDQAETYRSRATNILIQRIASNNAYSDAILGTVATMTLGARLMNDEVTWRTHIDGCAQIILQRCERGRSDVPYWFSDFLILDATNDVLGFPRFYHKNIIEALRVCGCHQVLHIASLCDNLIGLRKAAKEHPNARMILVYSHGLLSQARALERDENPSVQVTALTIQLILLLWWPPKEKINRTPIASRLKDAICRLRVRPCAYMDLTSCQLLMGIVSADEGSETRRWFLKRLSMAMQTVQGEASIALLERVKQASYSHISSLC